MADTIPTDNDGNLIPDRHALLQQASKNTRPQAIKGAQPKQPRKRRGWKIARHGISGIMNAVVIAGAVLYTSPELPQTIKASLSSTSENGLTSSPRPVPRPTRQP